MKKFIISIGIVAFVLALFLELEIQSRDNDYIYEISEVNGNEIRGVALSKKGKDNLGIFLYNYNKGLEVGDKISVVWGENNEILSIEHID